MKKTNAVLRYLKGRRVSGGLEDSVRNLTGDFK